MNRRQLFSAMAATATAQLLSVVKKPFAHGKIFESASYRLPPSVQFEIAAMMERLCEQHGGHWMMLGIPRQHFVTKVNWSKPPDIDVSFYTDADESWIGKGDLLVAFDRVNALLMCARSKA